jgi:hypothetical protein
MYRPQIPERCEHVATYNVIVITQFQVCTVRAQQANMTTCSEGDGAESQHECANAWYLFHFVKHAAAICNYDWPDKMLNTFCVYLTLDRHCAQGPASILTCCV